MINYTRKKNRWYSTALVLCLFAFSGVFANHNVSRTTLGLIEVTSIKKVKDASFGSPSFVSSIPENGATGISKSANIVLNFSEAISSGTIDATNIKISGSQTGNLAATFSGGGTAQITIIPTTEFKPGELITITLLTGLQSLATNESLSSAYTIQFTVGTAAIDYYNLPTTPIKTTIASGVNTDGLKSIYTIDLDGDGDLDILGALDLGNKLIWYENDGNQNFTANIIDSSADANTLHSVFSIDLDDDGDMDIVASAKTETADLLYYINNGNQVFTKFKRDIAVIGESSKTVYVADMDNDGDKDMVYLSISGNGYVAIAKNDGGLSFSDTTVIVDNSMAAPWGMYVVDIDNDADLDIIVGTSNGGTNTDIISWYQNDGTGSFTEQNITTSANSVRSIFAIDIDGDNDMDLLSTSFDNNTVSWWQNDGNQIYTKIDVDTDANGAQEVTAADVDGDGDIDILSANQTDTSIVLYLNNGSEVFTKKIVNNSLTGAYFVRFADVDSDGDLDIISSSTSDGLSWYENKLTNSWTGATDTNWDTTTNWSLGVIPTRSTNVLIPNTINKPIAINGSSKSHIYINELILNSDASLTVSGFIYIDNTSIGAITLESGSSLIAKATRAAFNLTYKRKLKTTGWYLISSPVIGESVVDFVTNNSLVLGSGTGVDQNVAIAPYDNTQISDADRWSYYTVGQTDGLNGDDTANNLTSGKGFSTKLTVVEDITFTGEMARSGVVVPISIGVGSAYNLIGNPYPSYIPLNTAADNTNNILKINDTDNDYLSEKTIYIWDQSLNSSTGGYLSINNASPARFISPGQGFFVSANGDHDFIFSEAMQSHQTTDVFNKNINARPEIKLEMSNGTQKSTSEIYYINGTTLGFDDGYDSTIFGGITNDFAVYTNLLADNQGQKLAIQSLPDSDYENMVIPVGVNALSNNKIEFSLTALNMPNDFHVYLEDKVLNSYTQLDKDNTSYSVTLDADHNGAGRFYIHTSSKEVLSMDSEVLENISVYKSSESTLTVSGIYEGKTSLEIINLIGQQVFETNFIGKGVNDILLPSSLKKGIYVIKIDTEKGTLNKKFLN